MFKVRGLGVVPYNSSQGLKNPQLTVFLLKCETAADSACMSIAQRFIVKNQFEFEFDKHFPVSFHFHCLWDKILCKYFVLLLFDVVVTHRSCVFFLQYCW